MKKNRLALAAAGFLAFGGCTTTARAPQGSPLTQADLDSITAAYQLVMFDLQECALLPAHVSAPQVASVAAKICGDAAHFKPLLEQIAAAHDVTLPNALSYGLTAQYASLFYRPWPSFDVNYLQDQISSHEQALAVFRQETQQATDPGIKSFAEENVHVVQDNLERLRQALKEIGSS
jgi:predicted outer membrane protein